MAKNQNRKPAKHNDPMGLATTAFLAGCFAEMFLLMIRRFYVNGSIEQVLGWYTALPLLAIAGAVILLVGVAMYAKLRKDKNKRAYGSWTAAVGAFVALTCALVRINMSFLTLLTTLVPVAMLLVLVWLLYDRECALTLTILTGALLILWVCRRLGGNPALGLALKLVGIGYILLLVAIVMLAKKGKLPLLNTSDDKLPVYIGSALSVVAIAVALFSTSLAYYAMWLLAAVVFALAVYYTVKQL